MGLPYLPSALHPPLPMHSPSPQHGLPRRLSRLRELLLGQPLHPQQDEGGRRTILTRCTRQYATHTVTMTMTMMSCVMAKGLYGDVFDAVVYTSHLCAWFKRSLLNRHDMRLLAATAALYGRLHSVLRLRQRLFAVKKSNPLQSKATPCRTQTRHFTVKKAALCCC